jgi:Mrp family chromosome partitioning ATPase
VADHRKRRGKLVTDRELIKDADLTDPDVQVFDLGVEESEEPQAPPRKPSKWADDMRTTVWDSGQEAPPPAQDPLQTGRFKRRADPYPPPPQDADPYPPPPQDMEGYDDPRATIEEVPSHLEAVAMPLSEVPNTYRPRTIDVEPDHHRDRRRRPLQIEAPLRISVRAVARVSPDPQLWMLTKPDSPMAEQYRVLAQKLKEGRVYRVVAVASAAKGEEGAITATNLALALAEGRRSRVMLVDADLRGGKIGPLLDLQEGPGLGEQIHNHHREPEQAWVVLGLSEGLRFLPSGPAEKNPASLLNTDVVSDLMAEARRSFDFIVIYAPPVMDTADLSILQDHLDGAILAVRAGVTRKDSVSGSINRLGENKFIGTVMVGVKR